MLKEVAENSDSVMFIQSKHFKAMCTFLLLALQEHFYLQYIITSPPQNMLITAEFELEKQFSLLLSAFPVDGRVKRLATMVESASTETGVVTIEGRLRSLIDNIRFRPRFISSMSNLATSSNHCMRIFSSQGAVSGEKYVLCVCGSLFAAAEAREALYSWYPSEFSANDWVRQCDEL